MDAHHANFNPDSKILTLEQTAVIEAEKAKPSSEPKYWAKGSCNKCYGRGTVGTVTVTKGTNKIINSQLCRCATRNFVRWRDAFVAEFVKNHRAADR